MKKYIYFYVHGCAQCQKINDYIINGDLWDLAPFDLGYYLNHNLAKKYEVGDAPTIVVTDEDGVLITLIHAGGLDLATLRNILYDEPMPEVIVPEEETAVPEDESTGTTENTEL